MFPIKKAFVKFDVESLLEEGEEDADVRENKILKTPLKDSGPNPNISTIINFKLALPKNIDLIPFLTCTVHDNIV